jgi:O-antigen ligase
VEGLVVTALLLLIAGVAGALVFRGGSGAGVDERVEWIARRRRLLGGVAAALALGLPLLAAAVDRQPDVPERATAARLADVSSARYRYWEVAIGSAADEPLRGVGPGGFAAEWARERDVGTPAKDAHSLYLETPAELGVVGLLLLGAMLAGVVTGAARALRADPAFAAGPTAAAAAWAAHAGLDWDWEMPALTLVALVLAGALVARAELELSARRAG